MKEKIPYLNEPKLQEGYAQVVSELLGDSGKLHISCAAITPGLIVQKKTRHQHCATYPSGIDRIYVLGIPPSGKQGEQRGIGIMCSSKSDFYKQLTEKGYSESREGRTGALLKRLDTTVELLTELRHLESLVFSSKP